MHPAINITDEDISYSESILLPEGKTFDEERRIFIRNLDTIDLQAVPGSGKTTALLAKLLILERKLPFNDGSGVLVISHTNAAINEIKHKIQKHCPNLFSYPNFVGTIQSFVDDFLAIPYYTNKYGKKPVRIDNEAFSEISEALFSFNLNGYSIQEQKNARYFLKSKDILHTYRLEIQNDRLEILSELNGKPVVFEKPRKGKNWVDFTDEEKKKIRKWLFDFKMRVWEKGILHFDDAYFLADVYLKKMPDIRILLQKRFSYVFVDEMQDMDKHQYNLLENIFFNNNQSISKYQRIGDKNQSIFNGDAKLDVIWTDRAHLLHLNGSQRLTPAIANVVNRFALHRPTGYGIIGLREGSIKPHIIKYSTGSIQTVIPKYFELITDLQANGHFPLEPKHPIKIVAWNSIWKTQDEKSNPNSVRLVDYHLTFNRDENKLKVDYPCLKAYLYYFDKNKSTLEAIRKNLLNALLRILRIESVFDTEDRSFTKKRLIEVIKEISTVKQTIHYEVFKLNLYNWSIGVIMGKTDEVWESIKIYIPEFLQLFNKNAVHSQEFITTDIVKTDTNDQELKPNNKLKFDNIDVEVTTVHSVKGQTHSATLYLETSYYGQHETERLNNQLLGQVFTDNRVRHKESVKIAYVGFSRPTDFLCIAIHQERFDNLLQNIDVDEWEIINLN